MERFFHCNMGTGSTKQMEDVCSQQGCPHQEEKASATKRRAISVQAC